MSTVTSDNMNSGEPSVNGAFLNGNSHLVYSSTELPSPPSTVPDIESQAYSPVYPTYDEAFPALNTIEIGHASAPMTNTNGYASPKNVATIGHHNQLNKSEAWNHAKMAVKPSTVTQIFHIPAEERRFKFCSDVGTSTFGQALDEQAKICHDIMEKTNVSVEMSLAKDQSLTVLVTGKLDDVVVARRQVIQQLQTQINESINIPKEHHGYVLGARGKRLQDLEKETATKIIIPRSEENSDMIKIIGTREGIDRARHELQCISDEQSKLAFERFNIPKIFHPFISGPNNENISRWQTQYNARVNMPPFSVEKSEITVSGEKEGVHETVRQIQEIFQEKQRKSTHVSVEVRKSQHKYVIGQRRSGITEILDKTGVSVEVPPLESAEETITLRGSAQDLGNALTMLYSKANSVMIAELVTPAWLHRFIIGRKGEGIKKVTQDRPKVHIEFLSSENKIRIEGPPEDVEWSQAELEKIVKHFQSTMALKELNINPKFHPFIIGKNGVNVLRIKNETGVNIRIPLDHELNSIVKIEGEKAQVEIAAKDIMDQVKRLENEKNRDIIIENRFHRDFIGANGQKIREVKDLFPEVSINFPNPSSKSDVVQLRGPRQDVDKCYLHLDKQHREMVENGYTIQVPIKKQFHRNVIGKNGQTVKKIRDETDAKIDLPSENSKSDIIIVTGKKQNAEKAKKMIEAIQKELNSLVTEEVKIEQKNINEFMTQGSMKKIRGETDARINVDQRESGVVIRVSGSPASVEETRKKIETLSAKISLTVTQDMKIDPKYHRHFVLRRGEVINQITEECGGPSISFPRVGTKSDIVVVKGAAESVEKAIGRLKEMVKVLENQVTIQCVIPNRYHGVVLGTRGSRVQEVTKTCNVNIKFPERRDSPKSEATPKSETNGHSEETETNPDDIINITGTKEDCEKAAESLKSFVPVTKEVTVPYEFHRFLIGTKGRDIRKMMDEYDVQISVPSANSESDCIKVTGVENNVIEACKAIEKRTEELEEEKKDRELRSFSMTIEVDVKHHPKIIGRRGATITTLREQYDVNITFPERNASNQNIVTLTGYEAYCQKAAKKILKIVSDLEKQITMSVKINNKIHPRLIGTKGRSIAKIMTEFDVDIRFPGRDSEDKDTVFVTGDEEKVLDCKDHLMQITDDYEDELLERESIDRFLKPPSKTQNDSPQRNKQREFIVRGAPWEHNGTESVPDTTSTTEFPSFLPSPDSKDKPSQESASPTSAWGTSG